MNETKYLPKTLAEVFAASVEHVVKHDSFHKMHYEYTLRVEAAPTGCAFHVAHHVQPLVPPPLPVRTPRLALAQRKVRKPARLRPRFLASA